MQQGPYANAGKRVLIQKYKRNRTLRPFEYLKTTLVLTPQQLKAKKQKLKAFGDAVAMARNELLLTTSTAKNLYAIVNGIGPKASAKFAFPFDVDSTKTVKPGSDKITSKLILKLDALDQLWDIKISKTMREWLAKRYEDANFLAFQSKPDMYIPFRSNRPPIGCIRPTRTKLVKRGGLKHNECPCARALSEKLVRLSHSGAIPAKISIELYRIVNRIKYDTMKEVRPEDMRQFYPSGKRDIKLDEKMAKTLLDLIVEIHAAKPNLDLGEYDDECAKLCVKLLKAMQKDYPQLFGKRKDDFDLMKL